MSYRSKIKQSFFYKAWGYIQVSYRNNPSYIFPDMAHTYFPRFRHLPVEWQYYIPKFLFSASFVAPSASSLLILSTILTLLCGWY